MDDIQSPNLISKLLNKLSGSHAPENTEELLELLQSLTLQNVIDGDY